MTNPLNSYFLMENCDQVLKTCNFLGTEGENCASQFCTGFPSTSGTCPEIALDPQNCYSSSDPATCLNKWVHNGGGAAPNPCASVVSVMASCSSADPALFPSNSIYTSGPQATALAGCICYDQEKAYHPEILDGFASECVSSGSAAHSTYFPYASRLNGFCTNIGGPATAAASTTTLKATATAGSGNQVTSSGSVSVKSSMLPASGTASAVITSSASLASASASSSNKVTNSTGAGILLS